MKKIIYALLIILVFFNTSAAYSQSGEATGSSETNEIQGLKDRLAEKVAEMRKKNDRAISGNITTVSSTSLKIKTSDETIFDVKLDKDLTKFYKIDDGEKTEITQEDLDKGAYIIVTGPISGKSITANIIYQDEQFLTGSGRVTEVNTTDFYITVIAEDKETYTLDVETFTKKFILPLKSFEPELTTLAKIKEGDTLHFVVTRTGEEKEKNRYSATKFLIIPQEYFTK